MTSYRKASELLRAARYCRVMYSENLTWEMKLIHETVRRIHRSRLMMRPGLINHILDLAIAERERVGD